MKMLMVLMSHQITGFNDKKNLIISQIQQQITTGYFSLKNI